MRQNQCANRDFATIPMERATWSEGDGGCHARGRARPETAES